MDIEKICKANKNDKNLNNDFIEYFLWYAPTKQSYIKQYEVIDNVLKNKDIDEYLEFLLRRDFEIKKIDKKIDNNIDWIRNEKQTYEPQLLINKGKKSKSFYLLIIEGIRNSIAHGTFGINDNKIVTFISQYKPQLNSTIHFFLQFNANKNNITKMQKMMQKLSMVRNDYEFKLAILFDKVKYNKPFKCKVCKNKIFVHKYDGIINKDEAQRILKKISSKNTIIIVENKTNFKNNENINNNIFMTVDEFFKEIVKSN